jgi:hypothetical protein
MSHAPHRRSSKRHAISRRAFLAASIATPLGSALFRPRRSALFEPLPRPLVASDPGISHLELGFPDPVRWWHGDSSVAAALRAGQLRVPQDETRRPSRVRPKPEAPYDTWRAYLSSRFPELRRHFVFEYYPWYAANPWQHWNDAERNPPYDIAANAVPLLGPYDSRDRAVLERHARWIAESGVGAINVSWWGPGSYPDQNVPVIMDVMRAHDIHVTFHLEPYDNARALRYSDDILYLIGNYGDKRRWDCFLLLRSADGRAGPVFKSFRTILPPQTTDCHGIVHQVPDYTVDDVWRRQTDRVRRELVHDFDSVTLLADSLDIARTSTGGFDGIAIYDNFVRPPIWRSYAERAAAAGLVFSFNVNAGFDGIRPRTIPPDSCYQPLPLEPPAADPDFTSPAGRLSVMTASMSRIQESFEATLEAQCAAELSNVKKGVFLTYVNSFNEWHEGTEFEPMKNAKDLLPEERSFGYHNVDNGTYRLDRLEDLIARVT